MNDAIEDLFDKGLDHFNVDSYDEAVKIFSEVLKMDPDHPDGWYYRGLAHANKGSFDMAIDDFTKAVEKNPHDIDSYIGRGEAWQSKGKFKRALEDFRKALEIQPDNPDFKNLVNDMEEQLQTLWGVAGDIRSKQSSRCFSLQYGLV